MLCNLSSLRQIVLQSAPRWKLEPLREEECDEHGFTRQESNRWTGRSEKLSESFRPNILGIWFRRLIEDVGLFVMNIAAAESR